MQIINHTPSNLFWWRPRYDVSIFVVLGLFRFWSAVMETFDDRQKFSVRYVLVELRRSFLPKILKRQVVRFRITNCEILALALDECSYRFFGKCFKFPFVR